MVGLLVLMGLAGNVLAGAAPVPVPPIDMPTVRFHQTFDLKPNGDIVFKNESVFSVRMYDQVKSAGTGVGRLLRELGMIDPTQEIRITRTTFDDPHNTLVVTGTLVGALRHQGGKWVLQVNRPERLDVVDNHTGTLVLMDLSHLDNGVRVGGSTRINFPPGARDVNYDAAQGLLGFTMPAPDYKVYKTADVNLSLKVRTEIMSCVGSVYNNPQFTSLWVAKSLFYNKGPGAVEDFQIRFRLRGYTSWSEWKRTLIVYPTQTVVEVYYPAMDQKVCSLSASTPVVLEAAWTYRAPEGRVVEKSDFRILTILGGSTVVLFDPSAPDSPLGSELWEMPQIVLSAFTTGDDPIVADFAAVVGRRAGVILPVHANANAYRFAQALYEQMATDGVTRSPESDLWKPGARVTLKFPRTVLKDRSGTCVDLSILYAAVCQSAGLGAELALSPGRCFPVLRMPEGGTLAVLIGEVNHERPFDQVVLNGQRELAQAVTGGRVRLVDLEKMRSNGLPSPRLPDLKVNTLSGWGIRPFGSNKPDPFKSEADKKYELDLPGRTPTPCVQCPPCPTATPTPPMAKPSPSPLDGPNRS